MADEAVLHEASVRVLKTIYARARYLDELADEFRDTNGTMFSMLHHSAHTLREMTRAIDMAVLGLPVPSDPPLRKPAHSPSVTIL